MKLFCRIIVVTELLITFSAPALAQVASSLTQNNLLLPAIASSKPSIKELRLISYQPSHGNDEDIYVPVSMRAGLFTLAANTAVLRHMGNTHVTMEESGVLTLRHGETLIFSSEPTTVNSGEYQLTIAANAVVLLSNSDEIVTVRNLYEKTPYSVKVFVDSKSTVLLPVGKEVALGRNMHDLIAALKSDLIGRRSIRGYDLASGHSIVQCDVSLMSLMQNEDVLKQLILSIRKDDLRVAKQLITTAAALSQATSNRGAYTPIIH